MNQWRDIVNNLSSSSLAPQRIKPSININGLLSIPFKLIRSVVQTPSLVLKRLGLDRLNQLFDMVFNRIPIISSIKKYLFDNKDTNQIASKDKENDREAVLKVTSCPSRDF